MKRFLVCCVACGHGEGNIYPSWKIYPLKHAHTIDEVTVPSKTIFCFFADANTEKELRSQLMLSKVSEAVFSFDASEHLKIDTVYFFGIFGWDETEKVIYNETVPAHTVVSQLEHINYKVVEP